MTTVRECVLLAFAFCRIGLYTCYRRIFYGPPPPPRPGFSAICIGITGAGKSKVLAVLCSEKDEIIPTQGFSIKDVPFENAILHVKEIGGSEMLRKYWKKYYRGVQGIIFVVDSSCDEDTLKIASEEFCKAIMDPDLAGLPLLVLLNSIDQSKARSIEEITDAFNINELCSERKWSIRNCYACDADSASFLALILAS
ncbi:uncharacterized protein TRIADDRAFT_54332 [Trichoplax adhaerens]|uniref:ADP-ribosylation factor-like protein 15 n=1 Tax=Trichoplax adhaerens TaxID=10228 RepID=B3RRR0_TRIAD|nr:hypothetical protein TRIADDRAFT_54332 [Trichoplax adhaerens]EDV26394.1 hypothetical protein TRIADDRAFT_54332 [Trichoplax adhaerens]|eukprot:XP_002110390.1 hypothetical protein TRIADDRAFT_54332 [Trichoplax adhaerens]